MADVLIVLVPFLILGAAFWLIPAGLIATSVRSCWADRGHLRTTRLRWLPIAIGLGIALPTAFFGRGNWALGMFFMAALFFVALPALIAWALLRLMDRGKTAQPIILAIAITIGWTFSAIPLGRVVAAYEANSMKEAFLPIIAQIEEYRTTHGRFPSSLDDISPTVILTSDRHFYRGDTDSFEIGFFDNTSWFSTYTYSSRTRKWVYYED